MEMNMDYQFAPTRSNAYRLARYVILPEITAEVAIGQTVRMRDKVAEIAPRYITSEQASTLIPKAKAEGSDKFISIVGFFAHYFADEMPTDWKNVGRGNFERIDAEAVAEQVIESADEDESGDVEFNGWVYAFSFPTIVKSEQPFPIKVGKTITDVDSRVMEQAKGSAIFEKPVVLGSWQVKRVGYAESAVHNVLKARGKWLEDAPGREWFLTTVSEISSIVEFIA